ncbi:hypothetical protein B296_00021631 [Ensete ventricosum]|uniref:Uncharacterized protein n=1 Tax=Ensete ventricosum TaxID=4639 RepID=A0A426YXF3_ENSVE|nr:hypothetical protein B296_00021631 [Ensete ventricosum]
MISWKRAVEAEIDEDQPAAAADEILLKKTRGASLISSAAAEGASAMVEENNQADGMEVDVNGCNQAEIDEDLHSRQLAVYGRTTMGRLFASNFSSIDPSHLQFVMAASILRAETFGIYVPDWATNPEKLAEAVDKSFLYKVLAGRHNLEDYRNTFASLARLPLFSTAESLPVPPKTIKSRQGLELDSV